MAKLTTIGFTQKNLETFVALLRRAGATKVVDIRLRPSSQLSGYAKPDDLRFVLALFDLAYVHRPSLAPSAALLDGYRKTRDWESYARAYTDLVVARGALADLMREAADHQVVSLLCSEHLPDRCHRRLLAELFVAEHREYELEHLVR